MCGVAGIRRFDGAPPDERLLRTMSRLLAHRGPDGEGWLVRGSVGLAHRRLSIIDLERSVQPMSSPRGDVHVCFNGEIFNYRRLRGTTPYDYRTSGDTEVLLAVHERYGAAGVARLIGQFAYALLDERTGDLWLHRDRLGVLPLYYYADDRQLVFASEVKAILPALPAGPQLDEASLRDYLARRSVPAPWTLFRGVRKLEPGCSLRVTATGVREPARYWSVPTAPERAVAAEAATDLLRRSLTTAVERSTVADVPVGAYLSGGLDSSLVVALMAAGGRRVETFAAGFDDPRADELPHARRVAALLGTTHHEVVVSPADFEQLWAPLTWHRDAPVSEASDVAVHRLAALARTRVKVVLSGEGSDELFGGYPKHRWAALTARAGLLPHPARGAALGALQHRLPPRLARARIAVRALAERTAAERLEAWFAPFTATEREALLPAVTEHDRHPDLGRHGDPLRRMLVHDTLGWLTDNLLERGDRMSMAASLELRPPFLDVDVVELAFALPSAAKVRGGDGKWVVRRVAAPLLPADLVARPKVGFRVPLDAWFRTGLRAMARGRLLDPGSLASTVLDRRVVEGLLDDHDRGRRNEELRIWTLLSLEVWHDVFFRRPLAADAADGGGRAA